MNRPPLEVADLVRVAGRIFIERSRRWITWQHLTVLRAIARCRTAALGGHLDECIDCGYRPAISYNSCRNRHCPKCQANTRDRWLEARRQELLPTRYVHVVFTLPHELAPLALQNKKLLYHLLLQTSAETLLEVARDQVPIHFISLIPEQQDAQCFDSACVSSILELMKATTAAVSAAVRRVTVACNPPAGDQPKLRTFHGSFGSAVGSIPGISLGFSIVMVRW